MDTENTFYKAPKNLWRAHGYYSLTTGEEVPLKESEKIVYTYMLDRLVFFVEKKGGQHFESQDTIAEGCGLEYRVVGRILRGFMDNGILHGEKTRPNGKGQWRWLYKKIEKNLKYWSRKKSVEDKPIEILEEDFDSPF